MGIILAQQRWYSPHVMRWLSRDPIEYDGGDNLYGYVLGNPVGLYDDTGESPAVVAEAIVVGAGIVGGYVACRLVGYCDFEEQISVDPNESLVPPVITLDPEAIGAPNGVSPAGEWSDTWCNEDASESRTGAGKNDPHGDGGRAIRKAEKQIEELEKLLPTATKKQRKKIKRKMDNIRKAAQRKRKGETHHVR